MDTPPAWPLERYLPLLRVYARQLNLDPRLRRRLGESDLVSETLVRALQGLDGCDAKTEGELVAWLRTILKRVTLDRIEFENARKRNPDRELDVGQVVDGSFDRIDGIIPDRGPSPSTIVANYELQLRVAAAIDQLPQDQRDAVILRDSHREPLSRIAEQLGKTERAVAGLLRRGHLRLRELLPDLR
jgi:RNA polymerase sigma-70 factor (ECF subfamily)